MQDSSRDESDNEVVKNVPIASTIVTGTSQSSPVPFLLDMLREARQTVAVLDESTSQWTIEPLRIRKGDGTTKIVEHSMWTLRPNEVVTNITVSTSAHENIFPTTTQDALECYNKILSTSWQPRGTTFSPAPAIGPPSAFGTSSTEMMLSSIIGMQSLKDQIRNTFSQIEYEKGQGDTSFWPGNMVLTGNAGTGKSTTARKLGNLLFETGALPGRDGKPVFVEVTPLKVPPNHVAASNFLNANAQEAVGGIYFLDEIYDYTESARKALFHLLDEYDGKVMFAVAGYSDKIDWFFSKNQGYPSRFPERLLFPDLKVDELMQVTDQKMVGLTRQYFDEAARSAMRRVMQLLHNSKDPQNGRGVEKLVVPSVEQAYKVRMAALHRTYRAKHDALKGMWTAEDIAQAEKKVSQQCAQKEAESRAAETTPGPSQVVAGDAGPSETGGGVQAEASSSAVVAVDDSEEDVPLTSRGGKQPVTSGGKSSSRKRKERESSSVVADATDAVQANFLLEDALRVLYPTPTDAIHMYRIDIFRALNESDDPTVRKGWKSLGDQTARQQVLLPHRSNKAANEMLRAAMLAVHGLEFGNYKASTKGEQSGMMVLDKNGLCMNESFAYQ